MATKKSILLTGGWLVLTLYALLKILTGTGVITLPAYVSVILLFGFSIIHCISRYGAKTFFAFFGLTFIVAWAYESLSIATGIPFGHYCYSDNLGIKLGNVPIFIMASYFAVGYLSWTLAFILLEKNSNILKGKYLFIIPVIAAFVMVMWDVASDPVPSTIHQNWIWKDGGPYFGVPFQNFLGWYLCVLTIYLSFALFLSKTAQPVNTYSKEKSFWAIPALMYASVQLSLPFQALFAVNEKVHAFGSIYSKSSVCTPGNPVQTWQSGDIYFSMTIIWIFGMVFLAVLSLFMIYKNQE